MGIAVAEKPIQFIDHHGFQIPRNLAWRTGRLDRFREVSDEHIAHLDRYAGLAEARNVVEIGCGVGRDAIPLSKRLGAEDSYLGIDIIKPSIEWARANITPKAPTFRFIHFDVSDKQHNPGGASRMAAYRIPVDDASQDLIFLYSVFTHMFPGDVAHYLTDFARILRPGGRVLASMFTMERDLIPHLAAVGGGGLRALTFAHEVEQGFFHNDPEVVPGATAYSPRRIADMSESAGLYPQSLVRGSWRKDGTGVITGQDLVVLAKPAF